MKKNDCVMLEAANSDKANKNLLCSSPQLYSALKLR